MSQWRINRDKMGKVLGASQDLGSGVERSVANNGYGWQDFIDWNAKQETPLDLSDKPPEPIPVDVSKEDAIAKIKAFKAKPKGSRTAQDRAELMDSIVEILGV